MDGAGASNAPRSLSKSSSSLNVRTVPPEATATSAPRADAASSGLIESSPPPTRATADLIDVLTAPYRPTAALPASLTARLLSGNSSSSLSLSSSRSDATACALIGEVDRAMRSRRISKGVIHPRG